MPDNATDSALLRIVVRDGLTLLDLADSLINDLGQACEDLQANPPMNSVTATGFAH
jgi:hypothetical protein